VDDHHDGVRPLATWQPKVAELQRLGPVHEPCIGVARRRLGQDSDALPSHAGIVADAQLRRSGLPLRGTKVSPGRETLE
jgi:hypothetical protein